MSRNIWFLKNKHIHISTMRWDEQQIPVIDSSVFRLKAELQTEHCEGCLLYDLYCGDILHGVFIQADAISSCTLRLGGQVKMSLYPQATKYTEWFASVSSPIPTM